MSDEIKEIKGNLDLDSEINPDTFTTKELLKHLYREQKLFRQEMLEFKKEFNSFKADKSLEREVSSLRIEFDHFKIEYDAHQKALEEVKEQADLKAKKTAGWIAIVISAIALIINFIVNFFKTGGQ